MEAFLTIGELADRSGVSTSALRFWEDQRLLSAERGPGGRRRYPRSALRRVAFVRVASSVGLSLAEVREALASLPDGRTPTARDWARLSRTWRSRLDERIAQLERLRDELDGCIGCGCLSLQRCRLYNRHDRAATTGTGPRYLLGDTRAQRG